MTRPVRRTAINWWLTIGLAFLWVTLWQELNAFNVVAGLLVAVLVQVALPLPPLRLDGRIRPLALAGFLVYFVGQMLLASWEVTRHVLDVRRLPRNAVIEVDLRSTSDIILTAVAIVTSLIPGSVVVEARRSTHTLFIHALGVGDAAGVERERRRALESERRLVRALGIPDSPTHASAPEATPPQDSPPQDSPPEPEVQ